MTQQNRKRFRILSLIAVLAIATGTVLWVSAQSTEETSESEATDQCSAEAEEQEAENTGENEAEAEEEEEVAVPVEVAEVTTGEITSYISATANLVAEDQVKVLSEAEGRVEELLVEEGDLVSKGQVLAVLVQDEAKIALSKVELKASNAKAALDRAEDTHQQGLISAEAFDKLKMEYDVARQEVAEAEWVLAKTVIRSPFSACVTERFITQGQHLRPGDELFTVADYNPLVARIYLPESDVIELEEGREVHIALAANGKLNFSGRIRQIAPVVDTATGTVKVTVEAVKPPAGVRPGAFVSIGIVREQHPAALLLPRESVIRELRAAHVFVSEDGTAIKKAVELGLEEGDLVEVISGVAEGDNVVVAGQGALDDGQKIKTL